MIYTGNLIIPSTLPMMPRRINLPPPSFRCFIYLRCFFPYSFPRSCAFLAPGIAPLSLILERVPSIAPFGRIFAAALRIAPSSLSVLRPSAIFLSPQNYCFFLIYASIWAIILLFCLILGYFGPYYDQRQPLSCL